MTAKGEYTAAGSVNWRNRLIQAAVSLIWAIMAPGWDDKVGTWAIHLEDDTPAIAASVRRRRARLVGTVCNRFIVRHGSSLGSGYVAGSRIAMVAVSLTLLRKGLQMALISVPMTTIGYISTDIRSGARRESDPWGPVCGS